jgi:hypothetical protein
MSRTGSQAGAGQAGQHGLALEAALPGPGRDQRPDRRVGLHLIQGGAGLDRQRPIERVEILGAVEGEGDAIGDFDSK